VSARPTCWYPCRITLAGVEVNRRAGVELWRWADVTLTAGSVVRKPGTGFRLAQSLSKRQVAARARSSARRVRAGTYQVTERYSQPQAIAAFVFVTSMWLVLAGMLAWMFTPFLRSLTWPISRTDWAVVCAALAMVSLGVVAASALLGTLFRRARLKPGVTTWGVQHVRHETAQGETTLAYDDFADVQHVPKLQAVLHVRMRDGRELILPRFNREAFELLEYIRPDIYARFLPPRRSIFRAIGSMLLTLSLPLAFLLVSAFLINAIVPLVSAAAFLTLVFVPLIWFAQKDDARKPRLPQV
jgi:hypothetical protein